MKAIERKESSNYLKEVKHLKKAFVILLALGLLFAMSSVALAVQDGGGKGNIIANQFNLNATADSTVNSLSNGKEKDWNYYEEGVRVKTLNTDTNTNTAETTEAAGYGTSTSVLSTHPYGTWNSPYTLGIDGYNYNDSQDYVTGANQVSNGTTMIFESGPHGGYLTSTHKCRECHAVHRAAGKFKLLRSDTRFEACDWCHGTGAGSGYNIQMDNNDSYSTEYNVGHTMGFGISSGKWKAPDDTYPAFTPNYWMGGFSCFDCHSPHANPARLLGYKDNGQVSGIQGVLDGKYYGIVNSGCDDWGKRLTWKNNPQGVDKPFFLSGSWLLIKNPDRETATTDTTVKSGVLELNGTPMSDIRLDAEGEVYDGTSTGGSLIDSTTGKLLNKNNRGRIAAPNVTIVAGKEIPDVVTADLLEFTTGKGYPVNKTPTDWNTPIGNARTLYMVDGSGKTGVATAFDKTGVTGKVAGFLGLTVRRSDAQATWTNTSGTSKEAAPNDYSDKYLGNNITYDSDNTNSSFDSTTTAARQAACNVWSINDFCADCHDGNSGLHTVQAPLFSEDRALRSQTQTSEAGGSPAVTGTISGTNPNYKGSYDLAYGHDTQPRH